MLLKTKLLLAYLVCKHLFKFLFIALPLQLTCYPVVAILLLFVPRHAEELPSAFKYYDNWSGPELDGLSGDPAQRAKFADPTGWWARYVWLVLRNPCDYFRAKVLGELASEVLVVDYFYKWAYIKPSRNQSVSIGDESPSQSGLRIGIMITASGKKIFEIYWVKNYSLFGRDLCHRLRLGHKLGEPGDPMPYQDLPEEKQAYMFSTSYSPFHPYTGVKK